MELVFDDDFFRDVMDAHADVFWSCKRCVEVEV